MDRETCRRMDAADPLRRFRDAFRLPEGVIYLDGNSLGPLMPAVERRLGQVIAGEWGRGLIRSWNDAGWIGLPARAAARIARLIGAAPDEVAVADSTSINLFKLLAGALALRPARRIILSERGNFPTDLYVAEGLAGLLGRGHELRLAEAGALMAALDEDVAVLLLTEVDFRTGRRHDMRALTRAAHDRGALVLWDLAHSAGALPVDLAAADADMAVGCGYKYLNGGPGAPAFLYVRRDLQEQMATPLAGWMGHAAPFDFVPGYRPARGIQRFLCGTPPILSLVALDAALEIWDEVDLAALRAKSLSLCELFIALVEARCGGHGLHLVSPREPERRGSQVSFAHAEGFAIVQALIARGAIGDFRSPDIMRFGFAPLYLRHEDVYDAVEMLAEVLNGREYEDPRHRVRGSVT
ncbi:MAG: kynureninase [Alphaproteobacteria bacterium]|nr:kynureninase [Alphaproteobacteria bacterium]